jgi:pyruvate/2-oxoglutarate dehydrogenase complex dihydrolipoamide dehydrogenase (E3) component
MRKFDALVIGAGQAGPLLAIRLAAAGRKTALIERGPVGGTGVNTGCTPTKTLVASAYCAQQMRRAAEYGITQTGPVQADMALVKARMDAIVVKKRDGLRGSLETTENCTLLNGHARFTGPHDVAVNGIT